MCSCWLRLHWINNFCNRIVEIVDQRMGEPDFDVNTLARELNMGRSSFFTKVKNLTGMTPSEFMQNQRINRAATLLRERAGFVGE